MIKLEEALDCEKALKEHLDNLKDNRFGSQIDAAIDAARKEVKLDHIAMIKLCYSIKAAMDEINARDSEFTLECAGSPMTALRTVDWLAITQIVEEMEL